MTKKIKIAALVSTVLLAFACGRASAPPSVDAQSRSSYDSEPRQPLSLPKDPAQQPLVVSPDMVLMTISLSTTQETFGASTQVLQSKTAQLITEMVWELRSICSI